MAGPVATAAVDGNNGVASLVSASILGYLLALPHTVWQRRAAGFQSNGHAGVAARARIGCSTVANRVTRTAIVC